MIFRVFVPNRRYMRASAVVIAGMAALGVLPATAAQVNWNVPTGNWSVGSNWDNAAGPDSGDIGAVANGGIATMTSTPQVTYGEIWAGNGGAATGGSGIINVIGGTDSSTTLTLLVSNFVSVGRQFLGDGSNNGSQLNISGYTSVFTSNVEIGQSWVNATNVETASTNALVTIGDQSTFTTSSHVWIGQSGSNTTAVADGTLTVKGNAVFTAAAVAYPQSVAVGFGGHNMGTLNIQDNGQFLCHTTFHAGWLDESVGIVNVKDNGVLTVDDTTQGFPFAIGDTANTTGTVNQSGNSTVNIGAPGANVMWVSIGASGHGTYNLLGGTLNSHANFAFNVGDGGGVGAMTVSGGTANLNGLYIGKIGGSIGTVTQSNGTVNVGVGTDFAQTEDVRIGGGGNADTAAKGTYNISGGAFHVAGNLQVGGFGTGTVNQSGGTLTCDTFMSIGRFATGTGTYTTIAGDLVQSNPACLILVGEEGNGTLNVGAEVSIASISPNLLLTPANVTAVGAVGVGWAATGVGKVNLYDGVLQTPVLEGGLGNSTLVFYGGTLRVGAGATANFLQGLTLAAVAGTAIIDTNGIDATVNQVLSHSASAPAVDGGLVKKGAGKLSLLQVNTYSGPTVVNAGTLAFSGGGAHTVRSINGAGGVLVDTGASLTLAANGTNSSVNKVGALSLAGVPGAWTGKMQINNNALVIQTDNGTASKASVVTALSDQVKQGASGTANGITSASVVADPAHKLTVVVDNGLLGLGSFNGTGVDANSVMVEATYFGDANLDRKVDVTDLGTLATNYGKSVPNGVIQGDFNRDGKVDVTDLGLLATDYGLGTTGGGYAVATVPEPASLAMAVLGLAPLLARRRTRPRFAWKDAHG